jgi:ligand-binding SRPBCC domain-containing protein
MKMKHLQFEQFLPISLEEAWDFFSTPKNLNRITPGDVHFKLLNELPDKIYPGMIITYDISPFLNIHFNWVTEITTVKHQEYFVDEQRKGPYRTWHHEHHFKETTGGVLMTDKLYYDIGKSVFGWLAGKLFVDKKVKAIFEYRRKQLEELFKKKPLL